MSEENLWGELPPEAQIETPASILKGQAAVLTRLSKGVLEGRVITQRMGDVLVHDLRVVVPLLENYAASILRVQHGINIYPLDFHDLLSGRDFVAYDVTVFRRELEVTLQSERVRNLLAVLLAQANDGVPAASAEEVPA